MCFRLISEGHSLTSLSLNYNPLVPPSTLTQLLLASVSTPLHSLSLKGCARGTPKHTHPNLDPGHDPNLDPGHDPNLDPGHDPGMTSVATDGFRVDSALLVALTAKLGGNSPLRRLQTPVPVGDDDVGRLTDVWVSVWGQMSHVTTDNYILHLDVKDVMDI